MQRIDSLEAGKRVLVKAGIMNEISEQLLVQNPHCSDVLVHMEKIGVFTNVIRENKNAFANLVNCVKFLTDTTVVDEDNKKDSIEALLELYQMLAGNQDVPSLLTADLHKTIIGSRAKSGSLAKLVHIMKLNQPLTSKFVENLFGDTYAYLRIYNILGDKISPQSEADACFLYLVNKASAGEVSALTEMLALDTFVSKLNWLNSEIFRILVDHICDNQELILGFRLLHDNKLLDEYRDKMVQNPGMSKALYILHQQKMLTKENADLAFTNPHFSKAESLCEMLGWLSYYRGKIKDKSNFLLQLLKDPELTQAMAVLRDIARDRSKKDWTEATKTRFEQDLQSLMQSAGVKCEDIQIKSAANNLTLFGAEEKLSLADCLVKIKQKYEVKEEPQAKLKASL